MNVLHEHVAAGSSKPGAGVQTRRIGSNMRRRRRDEAVPCGALKCPAVPDSALAAGEAARRGAPDAPRRNRHGFPAQHVGPCTTSHL